MGIYQGLVDLIGMVCVGGLIVAVMFGFVVVFGDLVPPAE